MVFEGESVLISGGTGSVGKTLVRRLLDSTGTQGTPRKIVVLSRGEAEQYAMREYYQRKGTAVSKLDFVIGDVRDYSTLSASLRDVDIVIHAAAMKQVPACEYFPYEAVRTNVEGTENIIRAIQNQDYPVKTVLGISTDKACKPTSCYGMTKAIQERQLAHANMRHPSTRFIGVRYGNVLASTGSVIPLFKEQIEKGGPVTATCEEMTRFFMSLDDAVDIIFAAIKGALPGETYIPRMPALRISDLAKAMIGKKKTELKYTGIRPGEKMHEILISADEIYRTSDRGKYYSIASNLPEIQMLPDELCLDKEYSSSDVVLPSNEVIGFLKKNSLL